MNARVYTWALTALTVLWVIWVPYFTLPQIGISWDEPFQRDYGNVLWNTLDSGNPSQLNSHSERYYGPLVPLILSGPEFLGLTPHDSEMALYETRHWINWVIFTLGLFCFFRLCKASRISTNSALLGTLILATTPVISGHALFNSKDIPFLVAIIGLLWASFSAASHPSWSTNTWLGIAMAAAILCRVNAVSLIGIIWLLIIILFQNRKQMIPWLGFSITIACGIVLIGWPTLWRDPIGAFSETWLRMANYPWTSTVLFDGGFISAQSLSWMYIPTWMGITLSPALIIVSVFAAISSMWMAQKANWKLTQSDRQTIITLVSGVAPIIGIWITSPTLYDGWRHLFFVYPPILMGVIYAIDRWPPYLSATTLTAIILHAVWIWALYFPFPHCYMNNLAGARESMIYHWETDYWGTTYRVLIESLPRDTIIVPDNPPARVTALALNRVVSDTLTSNGVIVTNHRWRQGPLPLPIVHSVVKDGIPLSTAYQLPGKDSHQ